MPNGYGAGAGKPQDVGYTRMGFLAVAGALALEVAPVAHLANLGHFLTGLQEDASAQLRTPGFRDDQRVVLIHFNADVEFVF